MIIHDVVQNSPEWYAVRLGIPTASEFSNIISPTGLESKSQEGYSDELLAELLAGESVESWEGNKWTDRGKELEEEAADFYASLTNDPITKVGFCTDDARTMGCSPDRFVGDDRLLEIKIPAPKTHVKYMRTGKIDSDYYPQIQGQLLITGRKSCDIISFHPKILPVIITVQRDEDYLFKMTKYLNNFNNLMNEKKKVLIQKGFLKE